MHAFSIRVGNNVGPDQMASFGSTMGFFSKKDKFGLSRTRVRNMVMDGFSSKKGSSLVNWKVIAYR